MANRHLMYNSTLDYIEQLEKEGKVFVVYPSKPIKVKRVEKNPKKLSALYEQGYNDIQNLYDSLIEWLNN